MSRAISKEKPALPEISELEDELIRVRSKNSTLYLTIRLLQTVAVIMALCMIIFFVLTPVLRIYGSSMSPTLNNKDLVIAGRGAEFESGDILAFYHNNRIIVKRCIACPGDWIDMDDDGNVYVNGTKLNEPYVVNKEKGECYMTFPFQIPEGRYFVLGDNRSISIDSRSMDIGCIANENIVGKIIFRLFPLNAFGSLSE